MSKHASLVLICAGESIWDEEKKIAGWTDVPLSEFGINQCKEAAYLLRGMKIDIAFTSMLKRGIHSASIILDEMDLNCTKFKKHWRLNPRHYGTSQGLLKSEAKKLENYEELDKGLIGKFGFISMSDETHPSHDFKYSLVPANYLPGSESLEDTLNRVTPYWYDKIAPSLLKGKNVMVISHRDTIRALRYLWKDFENDICTLNIACGVPRVYEFNEKLEIIGKKELGDPEEIQDRLRRS